MKGKTAIITGGAQGIGSVIALHLLKKGCSVVVLDNDAEAIADFIEDNQEFKENILAINCDVAKEDKVIDAARKVVERFKKIDYIINNAAIAINKAIMELSFEEWNRVVGVNLSSIFLITKYFRPYFRNNQGVIINMASTRAFMSESNTEAYSASKGGIYALTHSLAMSLGPVIRVNCISPGWIDVSNYQKKSERKQEKLSKEDHLQHPAGRVGTPQDIASMVEYLLSDKAEFITGQNFVIDGGITKKMIYF
ncbi:NAD(P)-dependent dehydrogenase (short-subunit alcohol dehydrogenase family) [Orenia metallireducens]|jgi:NAD(P)-dependent dehydrogenase (short-subunit alcohol dehydrogenase family)|uniref:NAD(P)-dependent dehydrogenase, short-chain alcohol dehydrogenase family n=1 Tax=Orenia metallireducens TaxID=1413210 RepID=A0A285I8C0_9FIRM|nr:glucose 1-dehydrogenase [Orenia metallireducens]PRX26897.1 NAD(P)-dependent dehydrogenase (short-subunit alcohol dehydrogenase family) [Orenia metallireducens]SNY43296.1 NAD(P)-dependent dehydrogenase, short-chain alcohol dehydrogenase family [Orenia metallireducens]